MDAGMLVMKRLFPMDFRAFEYEKRWDWMEIFKSQLNDLHEAGFVHRSLKQPSDNPDALYDNIFLTEKGIRLIDVGISALRSQAGDRLFQRFVEKELEELREFGEYFLSR